MLRSKAAAPIALVLSLVLITGVTLGPTGGSRAASFRWAPPMSPDTLVGGILNALLFAPLGAATRLFGAPQWVAAVTGVLLSLGVEMLQLFVVTGRHSEFQDIVANTLGAWAGWMILDRWLATTSAT